MKILITGISGYIGSRLAPRLLRDGHQVLGLRRSGGPPPGGVDAISGDAVSGEGLERALEGVDVAYYLIHSMDASSDGRFERRERLAATNFARAVAASGVRRTVYLGGLMPSGGPASAHLASRLEVERILESASPCAVALRASIVIGARSRPFRILVRLIERMPVMVLPGWHSNRTSPIDERDVIELLARAATDDRVCGKSLDAPGPEALTYGELIERIRAHLLIDRPTLSLRTFNATPLVSRLASALADEEIALVEPLMESLRSDLLARQRPANLALGVKLHSLDAAIEHALREWEAAEPLAAR